MEQIGRHRISSFSWSLILCYFICLSFEENQIFRSKNYPFFLFRRAWSRVLTDGRQSQKRRIDTGNFIARISRRRTWLYINIYLHLKYENANYPNPITLFDPKSYSTAKSFLITAVEVVERRTAVNVNNNNDSFVYLD